MAGEDDQNINNQPPNPPPPTQQAPHTVSTIKLPILKKGEYDIWAMKMEHYLAHTDYPVWEVIQNGNGPVSISTDTQGQIKILPPKSAEEILARERERKARTTLLMALPEDHLARFHNISDAKEMWDAIKTRFGGNAKNTGYKGRDQRTGKQEQPKALLTIDAGVIDWSGQAEEEEEDHALMAFNSNSSSNENPGNKDGRRSGKQEDSKELVTIDGEGVDWTSHSEEEEDYALFAPHEQQSGSDTEVNSCSNECKESYAKLKKLYDAQREQLSDASIEINAYTQGLKKVEAQLVAHQQGQLWYEEKIRVVQPKVWSDAPIIEEYESDSEDEHVSQHTKRKEQPSFAPNKQVKTPRETVQNQFTHSKNPRVDKKGLGLWFTAKEMFLYVMGKGAPGTLWEFQMDLYDGLRLRLTS
ncbi:hypothetical protein Tco_0010317 [Tanacetum coccineum]